MSGVKKLVWVWVEEDGDKFWRARVFCGEHTVHFAIDEGEPNMEGYLAFMSGIPKNKYTCVEELNGKKLFKTEEFAKEEAQKHWDKIISGCLEV